MSHASAVTTDARGGGVVVGRAASVLRWEMPICGAFSLGADAAVDVALFPAFSE